MAQYELLLPKMGESVAEATIIKWAKQPGDMIELDDTILEIATDKVDSEVPSPIAGKLIKQLFKEDEVVQVGAVIAIIETDANAVAAPAETAAAQPEAETVTEQIPGTEQLPSNDATAEPVKQSSSDRFYSPLVKNIAAQENIELSELDRITGTGAEGRLTKDDLLNYIQQKTGGVAPTATAAVQAAVPVVSSQPAPSKPVQPVVSMNGGDEIIEMDRMRKLIADHMVMSKHNSPHVTSFVEADVTNMVMWREKVKRNFEKRENEKITFTPIFIEAVTKAIKDFPMINVSVNGTQIIKKRDINIGMAAALPSGNLIVPVIKNADQLNLVGLTKSVNDLAIRARNSKLKPDETQGGTFTLTNVGSFGNVMGTPIINQPQVAILAVGAIKKKPAVLETEFGDVIAIRHMMFLSLSYDHRVVDGALGGSFVRRVADYLESWDINREI
ncbi:2-oxoglutarate dehydrogenase E2 component (dihydrolipoamide succinyltransferase) [Pedobacter steynii]|uniref:Dihydrolipoamide acetyltransferase component of pyruvate dehydrogenase complex n=1 Tax=Pedobacter steynii TaxID=430522 RepID=A0A1G9JU48_9SPHI|nr:dihydrolipoamide acetyltransferase family protein [Pedobacter steynii]NQX38353.1 2-oxo acid dehydrogenase subunit E2 [Pedobacter steynii]SDL40902.1 2-oxoglutarate dehydrogenase E2 component (dihydrolipoamide succinyltransferase) [Pedobacter steynii]